MTEASPTELSQIILNRIRKDGQITFASFMEAALYEPDLGYYTSPGHKVGAAGDFYTSMNVHSVFGRLIAREICRMWEVLGSPDSFTVAEPGAGAGQLAEDILNAIEELSPPLYSRLTYRLIEKEPTLRQVQLERLARHRDRLSWSGSEEFAAGAAAFTGCIVSNELFDAMPVHVVQMTAEGVKEVYVAAQDDRFVERLAPPSTPEIERYLQRYEVKLVPGQRAEINLAVAPWYAAAAAALAQGFIITVDYGYETEELYAPQRKDGTLLCYRRHSTNESPYQEVGGQDITSHVNFSHLMACGEDRGFRTVWFGEQYRFLLATGLMEEMAALESAARTEEDVLKNRLMLKKLMLPEGGMGDTFKVLIQSKGVSAPTLLCMRDWRKEL